MMTFSLSSSELKVRKKLRRWRQRKKIRERKKIFFVLLLILLLIFSDTLSETHLGIPLKQGRQYNRLLSRR
jgi:uncharacterized membrane protein YbaN (DUF454 family)